MSDATQAITISAALIAGLAGSAHCFAMCGGFAGALGMRNAAVAPNHAYTDAALYQLGRIGGYTLAGAIVGALGNTLLTAFDLPALANAVRASAGVLLVLLAARLLLGWNLLSGIERLGARFWKKLQPLVGRIVAHRGATRSLLLGLLWGWLPCGLVYSMLLFAALSGNGWQGAAIMLAFGLGTLPAMLASSLFATSLNAWSKNLRTRRVSGALMLTFGLWLAWTGVPSPTHQHHPAHAAFGKVTYATPR